MKKAFLALLAIISGYPSLAQKAQLLSQYAIIDPAYNASKCFPAPDIKSGAPWIYGYSELESWKLQMLRNEGKEAKLKVGYPGEYHQVYKKASFQLNNAKRRYIRSLTFYAVGDVKVMADDQLIYSSGAKTSRHYIALPKLTLIRKLQINLSTSGEPPCLLIENGAFCTSNTLWKWKPEKEEWQQAFQYRQLASGNPPHQGKLQELHLNPVTFNFNKKLYDFGRELLGYVYIESDSKPELGVGESTAEALDTSKEALEQTPEVIALQKGKWRSKVPLAFRYVNVVSGPGKVSCGALFYPEQYRGAFASSDSLLTRIWMNSAYTLRLCMDNFLIDGIKRDRLPWAGDLAMSMQANAYSFADKELVRKSLLVLGRAGIKQKDINGIIDYSLWWIISQDMYQLYYADTAHLKREWPRIKEALNVLNSRCDSLGFIKPKDSWLFIDWVDGNKNTALQILWWWAQKSGARLAHRVNDIEAMRFWDKHSGILKDQLTKDAWNNSKGAWMDDPYHPEKISRHANILAVISGMADSSQYGQIGKVLKGDEADKVGTPYMAGFENMALSRIGANQQFINNVKDYWGGMIKNGATTFWEAYDATQHGTELYAFYDRPYGKSLCHAWSAGPAAFLPSEILGVKPLQDGWKVFAVNPQLGALKWVDATIPTPHGNILIEIKNGIITMQVPKGTIAKWKNRFVYGPQKITSQIND